MKGQLTSSYLHDLDPAEPDCAHSKTTNLRQNSRHIMKPFKSRSSSFGYQAQLSCVVSLILVQTGHGNSQVSGPTI